MCKVYGVPQRCRARSGHAMAGRVQGGSRAHKLLPVVGQEVGLARGMVFLGYLLQCLLFLLLHRLHVPILKQTIFSFDVIIFLLCTIKNTRFWTTAAYAP